MDQPLTVAVLGAGSWGTALAIQLARSGHVTRLWGRNPHALNEMAAERENAQYLPGARFPDELSPCSDLSVAVARVQAVVLAVPSEGFRDLAHRMSCQLQTPVPPVVWVTKGLEVGTASWLHEVIEEECGRQVPKAILSGPSFAREVALGLPTAVTVACSDLQFAKHIATLFHMNAFRVYTSKDVVGVELGGALKNVLAIAAGISDGLGFGANARAALITRGLYEIMQLGERVGAQRQTLMGLSGLGDLVLTCTDDQSRNRRLGLAVGRGIPPEKARKAIGQAVEGAATAKVVMTLARSKQVEMPICSQVYRILYQALDPKTAVSELLARELKQETE